jgi:hypothetical protein
VTEDKLNQFINANPIWIIHAINVATKKHNLQIINPSTQLLETYVQLNPSTTLILMRTGKVVVVQQGCPERLFSGELKQPLDKTSPEAWYNLIEKAIHTVLIHHIETLVEDIDWASPEDFLNP